MTHNRILYGRAGALVIAVVVGLACTVLVFAVREAIMGFAIGLNGVGSTAGSSGSAPGLVVGGVWARLMANLLFKGPIPYTILCVFVSCLTYLATGYLGRWPSAVTAIRDAGQLKDALQNAAGDPERGIEDALGALPMESDVGGRLTRVYDAFRSGRDARDAEAENDRLAGIAEVSAQLSLQPLTFGEWLLPVLGFIGTVWGVILAVSDLQAGIVELFAKGDLNPNSLSSFTSGFDGLGLAFFTTLYGLVGLGVVGTWTFFVRRRVVRALAIIEEACGRALTNLTSDSVAGMLRTGLFLTDDEGELVLGEDGKPQLRFAHLLQDMHRGMLVTDDDGQLVLSESGHPQLQVAAVLEAMRDGLLRTDGDGNLVLDEEGRPQLTLEPLVRDLHAGFFVHDDLGELRRDENGLPIERSAELREVLRQGLFVTDETGALVLGEDDKPILRLRGAIELLADRQALITWLLAQEFLEVTEDEAWKIATGELETARGSREVMLANKNERRFRQLISELRFIEDQIEGVGKPGADGPTDATPLLGHRVLPPNGSPVRCAALDAGRFAVARETGEETNEQAVWLGHVEERVQGRYLVPVMDESEPIPEEPQGLAISGNRFACCFEGRKSLESYGLIRGVGSTEQVFERGTLRGASLTISVHGGAAHALVLLQEQDKSLIHSWRVDGTAPTGKTHVAAELSGDPQALARRANYGLAVASKNGTGTSVVQLKSGDVSKYQVPEDVLALGYAPTGELIYLTGDGRLGELDLRLKDPTVRLREGLQIDGNFDTLLITACDEVVLGRLGDSTLLIVPQGDSASPVGLKYPSAVTALSASVDGRCVIVGLEDGSAYFLDARRSLTPPAGQS